MRPQVIVVGNTIFTRYCVEHLMSNDYEVLGVIQTDDIVPDACDLGIFTASHQIRYKKIPNLTSISSILEFNEFTGIARPEFVLFLGFTGRPHSSIISSNVCIASHEGLLPEYAGHSPIPWTILNGIRDSGITFYRMSNNHPYGNILSQTKVQVAETDSSRELYSKICIESELALDDLRVILCFFLSKQKLFNDSLIKHFWGIFSYADCEIDWTKPCDKIVTLIKAATTPYHGAWTLHDSKKLTAWEAKPGKYLSNKPPGQLIYSDDEHYVVSTGSYDIDITRFETN